MLVQSWVHSLRYQAVSLLDFFLWRNINNFRLSSQLYSPQGQFLNKFNLHGPPQQKQQPPQPRGLCFTENGDILVTDFNKHKLIVIRSNFQVSVST